MITIKSFLSYVPQRRHGTLSFDFSNVVENVTSIFMHF